MNQNTKTVRVMNSLTGRIAVIPVTQFEHPVFGKNLVEVKNGVKPYVTSLYTPKTVEELVESRPEKFPSANTENEVED